MKNPVFACAFVLGASMFVAAQQTPPASTPPTFPSDHQQTTAPGQTSRPDAMPPDTTAPTSTPQSTSPDVNSPATTSGQTSGSSSATTSGSQDQTGSSASSAKAQSIQGCISQDTGMSGGYVLTDASGNKYSLTGDSSQFSSFVGQEVRVKGTLGQASAMGGSQSSSSANDQSASSSSSTSPSSSGAGASGAGSASAAAQTPLKVDSVKKVADTCSNAQPSK